MRTVPFLREHLTLLDARDYEKVNVLPYINSVFLDMAETSRWTYTLMNEGRVVTCIGVVPLWTGVWEVWQIPSVYVSKYAKSYCRTLTDMLSVMVEQENAWRIQTHSPADELHDRWMKFVGFECEGTLKQYSRNKADYRIWARRYNYGS